MEFSKILEGWRNKLLPPEHLKDLIKNTSEQRKVICRTCPLFSENKRKHTFIFRPDEHCTDCGCPLDARTKCLSCKCPLPDPLWNSIMSDKEYEELKELVK